MQRFLAIAVLLCINQAVHSAPSFFGQSFSSSSAVKPNGQFESSSIYTDSYGNRVINGLPSPINFLVPPSFPGQSLNQLTFSPDPVPIVIHKPPPPPKQHTVRTTFRPTIRPTFAIHQPALRPGKLPTGSKNEGFYVHDNSGDYVPDNRGQYRGN